MTTLPGRLRLRRRMRAKDGTATVIPPDPRKALSGELDPSLDALRASLAPHQRRLWLRRLVRRTWLALAAIAIGEALLWTVARFFPLEAAPLVAAGIPVVVLLVLVAFVILAPEGIVGLVQRLVKREHA